MERAASLGNETALIFLKNQRPDLHVLKMDDGREIVTSESLISEIRRLVTHGHPEALEIVQILRDTEPEVYSAKHLTFVFCCCRSPGRVFPADFTPSQADLELVLNTVWDHCTRFPCVPLPTEISHILAACIHMRDSSGRTLLHILARCGHTHEDDVMGRIGEVLIQHGCDLDLRDNHGSTPLTYAIFFRNFSLINILLENGAGQEESWSVETRRSQVWDAIEGYDFRILEIILPYASRVVLPKDTTDEPPEFIFLHKALVTCNAQRRISCGKEYGIRGVKTMDALFNYAFDNGIQIESFLQDLLQTAIIGGNDDLFQHCVIKYTTIQPPISQAAFSTLRVNYEYLLRFAISCVQKDIFLFLLEQGLDPNGTQGDEPPLQSAARQVGYASYFFRELLIRGADLAKLEDKGVDVLYRLLLDPLAAETVELVLTKYPSLLQTSLSVFNAPVLVFAVNYSAPSTVQAVLNAWSKSNNDVAIQFIDSALKSTELRYHRLETVECLKLLLSARGSAGTRPSVLGQALIHACRRGCVAAINELLTFGADPNFDEGGDLEETPFRTAYMRYAIYVRNVHPRMVALQQLEEAKFRQVYLLLTQYGLYEGNEFVLDKVKLEEFTNNFLRG